MKSTGYVIDGIYYREQPDMARLSAKRAATDKQYEHDRQREAHRIDMIQPWVNGKPNDEFRIHYPEESEKYFGKHKED